MDINTYYSFGNPYGVPQSDGDPLETTAPKIVDMAKYTGKAADDVDFIARRMKEIEAERVY